MNFIKTLIGKFTLPETVYICELGDYWVIAAWYEIFSYHDYHYISLEQNKWGKWVKGNTYIGKNRPLNKLGE